MPRWPHNWVAPFSRHIGTSLTRPRNMPVVRPAAFPAAQMRSTASTTTASSGASALYAIVRSARPINSASVPGARDGVDIVHPFDILDLRDDDHFRCSGADMGEDHPVCAAIERVQYMLGCGRRRADEDSLFPCPRGQDAIVEAAPVKQRVFGVEHQDIEAGRLSTSTTWGCGVFTHVPARRSPASNRWRKPTTAACSPIPHLRPGS